VAVRRGRDRERVGAYTEQSIFVALVGLGGVGNQRSTTFNLGFSRILLTLESSTNLNDAGRSLASYSKAISMDPLRSKNTSGRSNH
jgi:hypothetical protein